MIEVPFTVKSELIGKLGIDVALEEYSSEPRGTVPNEPFLFNANVEEVAEFLRRELFCSTLEEIHQHLSFVGKKSGSHIDPLHVHLLKGREVKIVEDPDLHLIWYYKDLYVKPLPHCLLSFSFWKKHLVDYSPPVPDQAFLYSAALGFVRSYAFLIRHESDFRIAQDKHLVPGKVSYRDFQRYIRHFCDVRDSEVSPRWEFGQLRLTRLNWAVRLVQPSSRRGKGFLQRMYYLQVYWQTGQFLAVLVAPTLFIYASISLLLSAMSLTHATRSPRWDALENVSWGFALAVIIMLAVLWSCIAVTVAGILLSQLLFALKNKRKPKLIHNSSFPNS